MSMYHVGKVRLHREGYKPAEPQSPMCRAQIEGICSPYDALEQLATVQTLHSTLSKKTGHEICPSDESVTWAMSFGEDI